MPGLSLKKEIVQKSLLQALTGEVTPRVPFWFMRQAGRYLPEYREVRKKAGSFLDLCFTPELATEATLQPLRRFDMDAAILFSDILVVPWALGQTVDFVEGEGPKLELMDSFDRLDVSGASKKLSSVYETVRRVRAQLPEDKALIGFAGAPWTVACYMIQGHGDGEFNAAKKMALADEKDFSGLIGILIEATSAHLLQQIEAGVDVVQIFDSWAGLLPEPMFLKWVVEPTRQIVTRIRDKYPDFPVIGFPRGAGALYPAYAARTGVSGMGLDTQAPLFWALRDCGDETCLQGNLDPAVLLAGGPALERETLRILKLAHGRPFIFNLGHGVIKETPPEHMTQLCNIVRSFRR